ncbi:MAG TPA: glycosyltransferase family A protein [Miltoncostaea sp.]|jgi:glycosyltransferase involved in cell wall biosynthesis|nr:glycosyltransferase family A protein [Miltoncostaea sp.]
MTMDGGGPRVAVIIPCFNDGTFVPEALASLRGQEPHEVVIVDDGSTDPDTLRVLDALERDGVRVVHQANGGLAAARNAGLAATTAPFVFPLDSDDRLTPGALAAMADAMAADPRVDVAWGDWHVFGEVDAVAPRASRLDPWMITYFNDLPAGAMVRRSALDATGGWLAGLDAYEDWDLWLSLAVRGARGVNVGRVTLEYRTHAQPRLWSTAMRQHESRVHSLASRHPDLFAARSANRRASRHPRRLKAAVTLIAAAPVSEHRRSRLYDVAQRTLVRDARWRFAGRAPRNPLLEAVGRRLHWRPA